MSAAVSFDLIVIGSGPGGEVAAIRAAQLGLKTALIEKAPHLGGTCLNWGCIPTKALLEAAKTYTKLQHAGDLGFNVGQVSYDWERILARKQGIVDAQRKGLRFLMKKNKIEVFQGHGRLAGKGQVSVTADDGKVTNLATKAVVLATGSRIRDLPFAKTNGKSIINSDDILSLKAVPKTLCVVGGGVVGTEFASLYGRFGTQVTIVELAPQILPFEDADTVKELVRHLKKQNISIETGSKLTAVQDQGDHALVTTEGQKPRAFEQVLIAIGRAPVTEDIGLATVGITTDRGFIKVNEHYRTSADWVWAIGDIIPTPALAHTASAEGIHAVEVIAGHKPPVIDYQANPNAIYTAPEIASIGRTEQALKEAKVEYKVAQFPFAPMARAKIDDATEGFVKILYEPKYRELLGVHIVGAKATEMIAEFALGKVLETTVDEIAHTIHPHPTISETIMEAAHVAMGGAIHL
ncbi:MAG: dihydrolipoyl dehydrogenase [Proteobacteria bacterium]|nr:dihydrolipoyl dehydrogenase [Pseudomonadota bacterium]